jgi:hypothetical protein
MFVHLLISLLALADPRAAASEGRSELRCQKVKGALSATATHLRPSLRGLKIVGIGQSEGDFSGPLHVEVFKPFFSNVLKVSFHVTSADGGITARGQTAATPDTMLPSIRRLEGNFEIAGDGAFENTNGSVLASGSADTHTRRISIEYHGEVCQLAA